MSDTPPLVTVTCVHHLRRAIALDAPRRQRPLVSACDRLRRPHPEPRSVMNWHRLIHGREKHTEQYHQAEQNTRDRAQINKDGRNEAHVSNYEV
jgi:hypothetical protein